MAYLAKDLSPEQRLAIESLLGRSISEREAIAIRAYQPAVLLPERRAEVVAELEAYFAALDAAREPASPHEADTIFEEAMRKTRRHYRTHH